MSLRTNEFGQPIGAAVEAWVPRQPPSRMDMEGQSCRLEPLDPARHTDGLFRLFAEAPDGRDWTYLTTEQPTDPVAYRKAVETQAASRDPLHFAIIVDGEPVGTCSFMRIDPANGVVEIGHITFSRRLQRTRAGTEAIFLLMRRAFDELGYRRLEWKCDALNVPSRKAATRYGFTFEGIFRKAVVVKGRNRDTAWYGIVDEDWPALRQAFEAWLSPQNFDASGRHRQSFADLRAEQAPAT